MAVRPERGAEVVREVRIAAPPERVFAFFTEPELMVRWKGGRAELEPEPGGVYRVDLHGNVVAGHYVEVVPHSRIVFTWGWEGEGSPVAPGASTVEVTLTPDGAGTLVRLVHRDLPAAAAELHGRGWDHYLSRLVPAVERGDAGPDTWEPPTEEETP